MRHFAIRILALLCVLAMLCAGCAKNEDKPKSSDDGGKAELPFQSGGTSGGTEEPKPAEQPDKPEEPAPAPEEPSYDDAYAAYLEVLSANREAILGYDWQKGCVLDEDTYMTVPTAPTEAVALADVWGDDTPELLYMTVQEYEGFRYAAALHVCTWDGAAAYELFNSGDSTVLDSQVGGGMGYRLFRLEGEKNLWIFADYYSEGDTQVYEKYTAEGEMKPELTCQCDSFPYEKADGEWDITQQWKLNGKESTQAEVEAKIPAEKAQDAGLIMRNLDYYEYADDPDVEAPENAYSYKRSGTALTCDAAIEFLRGELGQMPETMDEAAFFASIAGGFSFCSGVGGWSSELTVAPDGTFTGSFHDSDMGDTGEGYPDGTIYVCSFSGRFGKVRRIDEYTYSMRLLEIKTEKPAEQEWIEDNVRWISAMPYGLENADEIMVYLPGSWMANLPAGFVSWVSMPLAWGDDRPLLLPFCGLYNVAESEGWFGGEG